jgi:hypothetical protein
VDFIGEESCGFAPEIASLDSSGHDGLRSNGDKSAFQNRCPSPGAGLSGTGVSAVKHPNTAETPVTRAQPLRPG